MPPARTALASRTAGRLRVRAARTTGRTIGCARKPRGSTSGLGTGTGVTPMRVASSVMGRVVEVPVITLVRAVRRLGDGATVV